MYTQEIDQAGDFTALSTGEPSAVFFQVQRMLRLVSTAPPPINQNLPAQTAQSAATQCPKQLPRDSSTRLCSPRVKNGANKAEPVNSPSNFLETCALSTGLSPKTV
jgi:hypothetical protein